MVRTNATRQHNKRHLLLVLQVVSQVLRAAADVLQLLRQLLSGSLGCSQPLVCVGLGATPGVGFDLQCSLGCLGSSQFLGELFALLLHCLPGGR